MKVSTRCRVNPQPPVPWRCGSLFGERTMEGKIQAPCASSSTWPPRGRPTPGARVQGLCPPQTCPTHPASHQGVRPTGSERLGGVTVLGQKSLLFKDWSPGAGLSQNPFCRNLEGNVALRSSAAVFTYCKSRGLFAGVSLEGSYLIERKETNRK